MDDESVDDDIKVTPLFYADYLKNGTRYRHNYNGILVGTCTSPAQRCDVISNDVD